MSKEKKEIRDLTFEKVVKYQIEIKKEGSYTVRYETNKPNMLFAFSLVKDTLEGMIEMQNHQRDNGEEVDEQVLASTETVCGLLQETIQEITMDVYEEFRMEDSIIKLGIVKGQA